MIEVLRPGRRRTARPGRAQRLVPAGPNGWSQPEPNGSSWTGADPSRRRLLERLGKLDEALVDGRISPEQYEEMRARAEQEFTDWEMLWPGNAGSAT